MGILYEKMVWVFLWDCWGFDLEFMEALVRGLLDRMIEGV